MGNAPWASHPLERRPASAVWGTSRDSPRSGGETFTYAMFVSVSLFESITCTPRSEGPRSYRRLASNRVFCGASGGLAAPHRVRCLRTTGIEERSTLPRRPSRPARLDDRAKPLAKRHFGTALRYQTFPCNSADSESSKRGTCADRPGHDERPSPRRVRNCRTG